MKLIIDAGHGGRDTGAYHGGYFEKDLNLILAKRVRELLKEYNPKMTRTQDIELTWDIRSRTLIKDKHDVCLSLHFNAGGGTGVEAIHSAFTSKGKTLAREIVNSINNIVGIPKRPTPIFSKKNASGQDYYYMHRETGNTTTVIVEVFFLDNDIDKLFMNIEKIAQGIAQGFKRFAGTPAVQSDYKVIRKYDSDIHIYEAKTVGVDLGERFKLERVSKIVQDKLNKGEKIKAAINGGFFNLDGSREHLGLYIDEGLYYTQPSENFVDLIYYKNGRTEIRNMHGYDRVELSRLQAEAHWAIGTSYALVVDGKINLMNTDKFAHSKGKEPRTMIGQKADRTFVLAVADGRSAVSKGLTAQEQAQLMLELGCINAVNLDGGGSSTMVIIKDGKAEIVNNPSDGSERAVGSVILVKE